MTSSKSLYTCLHEKHVILLSVLENVLNVVSCPKSILFLSFCFQPKWWFWDPSMFLHVVSSFFPTSFPLYSVQLYVWRIFTYVNPFWWTSSWFLTPGIPNAVLNPLGVLGTCEETILGSTLRSREAVCTHLTESCQIALQINTQTLVPLQWNTLLVFPHPRQQMIIVKNSGFLTIRWSKMVSQICFNLSDMRQGSVFFFFLWVAY